MGLDGRTTALVIAFALLGACADVPKTSSRQEAVVYGVDDRTDVFAHPSMFWRDLAERSIVALVDEGDLDESDPENVQVLGSTLGVARGLCEGERFRDQPTGANCSGTLIDFDLVLTAGHCVEDTFECAETRFVFDYFYEADGRLATIESSDVYRCGELVVSVDDGSLDYAVVRLDRPVDAARRPAAVRMGDMALPVDTDLVVMGFGSGLPLKIDDGGKVLAPNAADREWFGANLDTFGGNSGSGVFNDAGEVVGILVRGERDYESRGPCDVVRVLPNDPDDGAQEECTYVARAIEGLCEVDTTSALCDGDGVCRVCRGGTDCPGELRCNRGACLARCGSARSCPDGFSCGGGLCQPAPTFECDGTDVMRLRCGRPDGVIESCDGFCVGAACVDALAGNTCATAIEIEPVSQVVEGTNGSLTTGNYEGSCSGSSLETVYRFEVDGLTSFRAYATGFDTTLYLRRECEDPASEIACDDDGGAGFDSLIERDLEAGTYFLFMDGFGSSAGDYELTLTFLSLGVDAGFDAGFDAGVDAGFDAGLDAGLDGGFDAGVPRPDAGRPDSGVVRRDAGPGRRDAGVPRVDAAVDAGFFEEPELVTFGWCNCAVGPGVVAPEGDSAPWAAIVFVAAVVLRRRRLPRA
ncbi:MAG: serine protease [Myxococcota bacterium]